MTNRPWSLALVSLFVLLSLILAGCERDRPAPTAAPRGTASPAPRGTVSPTLPPPPAQTKAVLPAAGSPTPGAPTPVPAGQATAIPPARLTPPSPTPPPPKPVPVLTPTPQRGQAGTQKSFSYVVKVGDTLSEIAEKFNTTSQAILALNPMADPNVLMAGQELQIPGEAPPEYGGMRTYTVQRGDTLSGIAVRFAVSVADLQRVNNISDPDAIYPGQQLRIPTSPASSAVPTSQPRTYVVRAGDTLYSIATRFGVTVWALQVANNISNPNAIYAGQELKIP